MQLLVLAIPVAFVVVMGWRHRWTADDAFVNFRVVDQIRHGNGPVFNAGERVEAFTSPLWLGVLLVGDLLLPIRLEWVAAVLALLSMAAAFVFAALGTARIWRDLVGAGWLVPLGLGVLAVLPPVWDYATSGLDTALGLAWIGGSWWALVRYCGRVRGETRPRAPAPWWTCVLLGLGPLVRPDLAVMSAAFVILVLVSQSKILPMVRVLAWAVALPAAYQLFRMAYFALLVPNTALTKEAGSSNWSRGWSYLLDLERPYVLWIPLVILLVAGAVPLVRVVRADGSRLFALLIATPVVAGVLHAVYVVRVGGDFMHGRLLLPSLFCALLPVGVVVVRGWQWLAAGALAMWLVVCALALRTDTDFFRDGISDERAVYIGLSQQAHPVTIDDYRSSPWGAAGFAARRLVADGKHGFIANGLDPSAPRASLPSAFPPTPIASVMANIGMYSYAAGPDVFVFDAFGLSDPITSRISTLPGFPAGHEKTADVAWFTARATQRKPGEADDVLAARRALRCDDLRDLVDAITDDLGPGRALENLFDSVRLTRLRVPTHPIDAARALCGTPTRNASEPSP